MSSEDQTDEDRQGTAHWPRRKRRWRGWRANIFVQNVTNSRGVTGGGYNNQTNFNRFWLNYTQPRTAGMTLEKSF